MEKLIQHHVKYKEIHDKDEIVLLTKSEHTKLHKRLRHEGKCNIPADELAKISLIANTRSPGHKAAVNAYVKSPRGKAIRAAYKKTPTCKSHQAAYAKKTIHRYLNG